jgi:hypothetical protein
VRRRPYASGSGSPPRVDGSRAQVQVPSALQELMQSAFEWQGSPEYILSHICNVQLWLAQKIPPWHDVPGACRHTPLVHSATSEQGAPVPHAHWPLALQLSARPLSQSVTGALQPQPVPAATQILLLVCREQSVQLAPQALARLHVVQAFPDELHFRPGWQPVVVFAVHVVWHLFALQENPPAQSPGVPFTQAPATSQLTGVIS